MDERQIKHALWAARNLVFEHDPMVPSETDGEPYCAFCGKSQYEEHHDPDCAWRVLQEALRELPG